MKLIDLHCDTFYKLYNDKTARFDANDGHIDLAKLKTAGSYIQTFALFDSKELHAYDYANLLDYIDYYWNVIRENTEVNPVLRLSDLSEHKVNALLSLEDGGSIDGNIGRIQEVYDKGVRMIALSWNFENCFGYPNSTEAETMSKGLKRFGFETVEQMNELGMIVDVSHMSDGCFFDVANTSKKPFIASHSNSRSLKAHTRNLTDDMIKRLADSGGVCGINFYADFLGEDPIGRVEDMLRHIRHIRDVGGMDVLSIGSDFDGIDSEVEISDISKIALLYDALKSGGFTEEETEKIFYKNALRVFEDVLN